MTKKEYIYARKMIRENGRSAMRWLSNKVWQQMDVLLSIQNSTDILAERQDVVAWCRREGIPYNFRQIR